MEIELEINDNQIIRAEQLYTFKSLNGSITNGESNIFGAIGEVVVYDYFKGKGKEVDFSSTYDYDMIINNDRIDVKTKAVAQFGNENVLASVSNWNYKQRCDYYFFVQVLHNKKYAQLLGYKNKFQFYEIGFEKKKGDIDTDGFVFRSDCYNLKVVDLDKFRR